MTTSNTPSQDSKHFTIHQLTSGIYAAIATWNGAAFSNSAIVDLGDQVLILDAMDTPTAANDLRQAAETLTGKEISFIILSHYHFDHRGGLQVFSPPSGILSTHQTREKILEDESDTEFNLEDEMKELKEYRLSMVERLASEQDQRWQENLEAAVSHTDYFIEAAPMIEIKFPNLTFTDKLVFFGEGRTAQLIHAGSGHTLSDSWLYLPKDNIAFIADLGFFQCHPFLGSSNPDGWVSILDQFENMKIDTFIPGHGPIGSISDVRKVKEYILALQELVQKVIVQGGTVEKALEEPIPGPFTDWVYGINRYENNVRFMYEECLNKTALQS